MPTVNFIERKPSRELSSFVEAFWQCQITEKGTIRLLPTACSELMAYKGSQGTGLVSIGPMSSAQLSHVMPGDLFVGARLKAGCRMDFLGRDFVDLRDSKIHGYAIDSLHIKHFETQLPNLNNLDQMEHEIEQLVEGLVHDKKILLDELVSSFIAIAEKHDGNISLTDTVAKLRLSERQFRRRFRKYTGLSPKEFLRICRQSAAAFELKHKERTIASVAAMGGYSDQAHFSNEFRQFVGVAPIVFEKELTLK